MGEIVKVDDELNIVKMNDFNNMGEALAYAEELIKCKLINFRKPEDAVMAFQMGKAVGLDPSIAATNFYVVNGRITYSVHLAAALAKKAGVEWEIIKDGEGVYDDKNNNVAPFMVTQIKFLRYHDKMKRTIENVFTYTWDDAARAGYTAKDNWSRMPRDIWAVQAQA